MAEDSAADDNDDDDDDDGDHDPSSGRLAAGCSRPRNSLVRSGPPTARGERRLGGITVSIITVSIITATGFASATTASTAAPAAD